MPTLELTEIDALYADLLTAREAAERATAALCVILGLLDYERVVHEPWRVETALEVARRQINGYAPPDECRRREIRLAELEAVLRLAAEFCAAFDGWKARQGAAWG